MMWKYRSLKLYYSFWCKKNVNISCKEIKKLSGQFCFKWTCRTYCHLFTQSSTKRHYGSCQLSFLQTILLWMLLHPSPEVQGQEWLGYIYRNRTMKGLHHCTTPTISQSGCPSVLSIARWDLPLSYKLIDIYWCQISSLPVYILWPSFELLSLLTW